MLAETLAHVQADLIALQVQDENYQAQIVQHMNATAAELVKLQLLIADLKMKRHKH